MTPAAGEPCPVCSSRAEPSPQSGEAATVLAVLGILFFILMTIAAAKGIFAATGN